MSENTEYFSSNALVAINNEYTSTPNSLANSTSSTISDNNGTPRILCNELLVDSHKSKSMEKLDQLSSLEREIAKLHHADDTTIDGPENARPDIVEDQSEVTNKLTLITPMNEKPLGKASINKDSCQDANIENKLDAITSGETALEHEDLIAVLKGLDGNTDETHNTKSGALLEGVTIEGEGEYQIMEVIDEDSNATEDNTKPMDGIVSSADPIIQSLNKTKTFGATALTVQEERALALEQIECLKTAHRRRKQDIKPIKQIDPALDLVSALEADWSEHEDEITEVQKIQTKPKKSAYKNKNVTSKTSEDKTKTPLITSVIVIPPSTPTESCTELQAATIPELSKVKTNDIINNSSNSGEIKDLKLQSTDNVDEIKKEDPQAIQSQSGFRRTRVIKRKIIWDPDAPETTFSYAKLVKPGTNSTKIKNESISTTSFKKQTPSSVNPTTIRKTQGLITLKSKKPTLDLNVDHTSSVKLEKGCALLKTTTEKEVLKPDNIADDHTSTPSVENKSSPKAVSLPKRRSQTPILNGPASSAGIKKKKITEVDRLMRDEGAVNMLNSLEKLEASLATSETKSIRPMMRSRAATICEKLPRKDTSPIENTTSSSPPATNLQSNRGKRTTKSRASSSWDYVYKKKKQDFDDSLIIRRRSNSSYSSTTSINRLSLDGQPSSIVSNSASNPSIKCNESISLPASTNESTSSKRSTSTPSNVKTSGTSKTRSTPTPPAGKSFEFAKPESKKSQKRTKSPATTLTNDMKKSAPTTSRRNARSPATTTEDKGKDVIKTSPTKSSVNIKEKKDAAPSSTTASDVVVKKSSKVAQIIFSTNKAKLSNTFTIQMLNKLVDILENLASDADCDVVVIGTSDANFCQGIDITELTTIAEEKRKHYAVNIANSAKNYLKTLATFPKPIIGGVNGNIMYFGVIQLALFDIVIASDKTTFETPYSKIGQIPEGYCLWHNMNKIRGSFKTKLFWLGEKVQSTEAALAGLVNKLTASNKVNDDALMTAKRIASLSSESYRVMRKTVINSHMDVIINSLDEEFTAIAKQWTSTECLENLKKYVGQN